MRQNGTLGTLLGQADGFFTTFFSETSEWSIVWIISGVLVAVVAGPFLWWLCFYKRFPSLREKSISPSLSQISISEKSVEQNTVDKGTDDEAAGQSENGVDQTLEEPEVKYPEAAVRAEKNARDALKEKLSLENGLPPKHRDGRNSKENEEAIAKVRAYVKETTKQQRSDAMSGEFPIDLPSESSTDALKGPSNLENGFPPKDLDDRNSKENEEAIAKVRAYVKETIEQQRSDAMSSSEMQTYLPSECSQIEPTPPLPENVIVDRVWYDPTQNEMYDIGTGGDSMEMETSMSFGMLTTEDQTVKKHSADKKVDDSSTTTTFIEKHTVEG